jgi:hypothetical protein
MSDAPHWTCVAHLAPNINIRCAWPAPHLAKFCHSHALGLQHRSLDRLRSMPRRCQCPEHATAYGARPRPLCPRRRSIALPSTSTTLPGARCRLRPRSTPLTSTASLTPLTVRFTDAPDSVLRSTPSFPSPQVIHKKLVNTPFGTDSPLF